METLETLRDEGSLRLYVLDDEVPDYVEVDAKLIALAKRLQLRLLTNDGPLARNAEMQGVQTCNLRRLAYEISPVVMPGDFVRVALTREGKEPGQGVGHLDDGSMVVVNGGVRSRRRSRGDAAGHVDRADERGPPRVRLRSKPTDRASHVVGRAIDVTASGGTLRPCRRRPSWLPGGVVRASAPRSSSPGSVARPCSTARSERRGTRVTGSSSCSPPTSGGQRPTGVARAPGGATRSDSVRAGLALVAADADIVVVHDAARPLASRTLFAAVIAAVARRRRRRDPRACRSSTR